MAPVRGRPQTLGGGEADTMLGPRVFRLDPPRELWGPGLRLAEPRKGTGDGRRRPCPETPTEDSTTWNLVFNVQI